MKSDCMGTQTGARKPARDDGRGCEDKADSKGA